MHVRVFAGFTHLWSIDDFLAQESMLAVLLHQ